MKPFRFRLRKLREHRERVRRERQAALARVDTRLERLHARDAALDADRARRMAEQDGRRRTSLIPPDEMLFLSWMAHLDREKQDLAVAIAACRAEREAARLALEEAAVELRILEKLEERRRSEHEAEELRGEIGELDEIGRAGAHRAGARFPGSSPTS